MGAARGAADAAAATQRNTYASTTEPRCSAPISSSRPQNRNSQAIASIDSTIERHLHVPHKNQESTHTITILSFEMKRERAFQFAGSRSIASSSSIASAPADTICNARATSSAAGQAFAGELRLSHNRSGPFGFSNLLQLSLYAQARHENDQQSKERKLEREEEGESSPECNS